MDIYVGNLSYSVTGDELNEAFSAYGDVSDAKVISDKYSGRSKGFGFVQMSDDEQANNAIEALNDSEMQGRNIKVNESQPKRSSGGHRDR